jgi:hypothetical protein
MKYAAIDAPCARCSHDSESAKLPSRWWRIACSKSNTERGLEIAELKTHIEKARAADQIDMREWINDGF